MSWAMKRNNKSWPWAARAGRSGGFRRQVACAAGRFQLTERVRDLGREQGPSPRRRQGPDSRIHETARRQVAAKGLDNFDFNFNPKDEPQPGLLPGRQGAHLPLLPPCPEPPESASGASLSCRGALEWQIEPATAGARSNPTLGMPAFRILLCFSFPKLRKPL